MLEPQSERAGYLENALAQHKASIEADNHSSAHDWLRLYLHELANKRAPNRLEVFKTPDTVLAHPEHMLPDISYMPITSQAYFLLLNDSGLLANFPTNLSKASAFEFIEQAFSRLFKDKTVFYLPGRNGQTANFAREMGAQIGLCTDERYILGILSYLNFGVLGMSATELADFVTNIAFLAEVKVSEMLFALAKFRPDIRELLADFDHDETHHKVHRVVPDQLNPDLVICTNMFNDKRFDQSGSVHNNNVSWQALLFRILAVGIPNQTTFAFVPAFEHIPVATAEEIQSLLQPFGQLNFYSSVEHGGNTIIASPADLTFTFRLTRQIEKPLLELS